MLPVKTQMHPSKVWSDACKKRKRRRRRWKVALTENLKGSLYYLFATKFKGLGSDQVRKCSIARGACVIIWAWLRCCMYVWGWTLRVSFGKGLTPNRKVNAKLRRPSAARPPLAAARRRHPSAWLPARRQDVISLIHELIKAR